MLIQVHVNDLSISSDLKASVSQPFYENSHLNTNLRYGQPAY
jgi:hypothetical protein